MKNFWLKINKPILALAPMAGITDSAFRQICKQSGADVVYSEMISVDGLFYNSKKTLELMRFAKKEQPIVIQLFGSKPKLFSHAVKEVAKLGASGVDINFGCPAPKIYKNNGGVSLMRDLNLCYEIVKAACSAAKIPVSIKIRTGINFQQGKVTAVDLIKKIKDLPVSAVMIHGRSYEQGFSGEIDLAMIKKVKQIFPGLVLGNGGIDTPAKAEEMLKKTGVDGLGLAQGVLGKPWLFKQIKDYLAKGQYQEITAKELKKIIIAHSQLMSKLKGQQGILEMRKHLAWYVRGFEQASLIRQKLIKVTTLKQISEILKNDL